MNHSEHDLPKQDMNNAIGNVQFGDGENVFTFAPVQIGTNIETQVVQISTEKVTQQPLIKASPYKGLKRFNFSDRDRFFGRDALIARLVKAVNQSNFSLILGASGSGKSSIVRAGLIPELKKTLASERFYDFIFTPNRNPFESFYRCLLSQEKDYYFEESEAAAARRIAPDTFSTVINNLKSLDERWLIFIDQFEELFTICSDPEVRQNFIDGIVQLVSAKDTSVRVVIAMRADFLEHFSFYPGLGIIANQNNIHLVIDMHSDELRQAIEQPAAKHGAIFEEGLVEQIIKELEGQSGYLPLLQYTLNLLWESECREEGTDGRPRIESRILCRSSYNLLEGVRGALQNRVNNIYGSLDQDGQASAKQIFLRMVSIIDTEAGTRAVSRRAYRSEFDGQYIESTLNKFINENLLVSGYENLSSKELSFGEESSTVAREQRATVEVAHEILLSSWGELKRWLEEEKETIILKNWLAEEVRRWQKIKLIDESRAQEELLKGSRLEQIVILRKKNSFERIGGLSSKENEFIDESIEFYEQLRKKDEEQQIRELNLTKEALKQERRARKAAQGRTVAVACIGFFALGFAFTNYLRSVRNEALAFTSRAETLLASNQSFDGLTESLKAGELIKKWSWLIGSNTEVAVAATIQQALHEVREKNRIQNHKLAVNETIFSSDGKLIISASDDKTIQLWNPDGTHVRTLEGHSSEVTSVCYSPNRSTVISASLDKTVRLWDLSNSSSKVIGQHEDNVIDIDCSNDGSKIVSIGFDGKIKIWTLNGELLHAWKFHGNPDSLHTASISVNSTNQVIASASSDGSIQLWNFNGDLINTITASKNPIWDIDFSPVENVLTSIDEEGVISLWALDEKPVQIHTFKDQASSNLVNGDTSHLQDGRLSINFSPDGQWLAATSLNTTLQLWNLKDKSLTTLHGHTSRGNSVAFSPNGSMLVSGGVDNALRLWNLSPRTGVFNFKNSRIIGFDSIRELVALAPTDFSEESVNIQPLNRESGRIKLKIISLISRISFSPEKDLIAIINNFIESDNSFKGVIELWSASGTFNLKLDGHTDAINSVTFSPDSEMLISASEDKTVKLWRTTGELIESLEGHLDRVIAAEFSPDGKTIASASADGTVRLWNLNGQEKQVLNGHSDQVNDISFNPNNTRLASASFDGTIKIWNLNGREVAILKGHKGRVHSVTYSPDGNLIASSGSDGTIRLWTKNGIEIKVLEVNNGEGLEVSFSSDGKVLYAISGANELDANTVARWDLSLNESQGQGCDWTRDYLNQFNNGGKKNENMSFCSS